MNDLFADLRFAIRSFRRTPIFTAVAVLSLALGIGANTAIFTLVNQLILRLLPVRDPEQIVLLAGRGRHYGGNNGRNATAYPMYQDIRDRNEVFSGMLCRYGVTLVVGTASQSEVVSSELVSGNYFPVLGVQAAAGRLFTSADDQRAGAHPLAVLSYAYWQSQFAGDTGIIGRTIRISNYPFTVVGVAQDGFNGLEPGLPAKVFLPVTMSEVVRPGFSDMYNRRQRWVNVYGRLKPGMTLERAAAGLQPLFHQILESDARLPAFRKASPYAKAEFLRMSLAVVPGSQGNSFLRRQYEKPLWVLMALTGLVLLIACANLASLLTARASARQKEIAIRLAIGSSRARIIRQLLTEGTLLSICGGAAGIGLATLMVKGLLRFLPVNVSGYTISPAPDARVLAFACGLSLATGILFSLIPALQSTKPDIAPTLKDQAGNIMGGSGQVGFRKALVASQVSLSLLLLIGAGLFIRSLSNLRSLDPGFRTDNIIQFTTNPRSVGYTTERARKFYLDLGQKLRATPGVAAAGMASMALLTGNEWDNNITIEGYNAKPTEDMDPHFNAVTAGYFDTLRIHVTAGRDFSSKDEFGAPGVAIVNQSFARHYFGGASPIGRRFGQGSDPGTPANIEIVGVVNDTRYEGLRDVIPNLVYLCAAQVPQFSQSFYVRAERDPQSMLPVVRAAMHDLDAAVPLIGLKTLDAQMDESLVTERMIATLAGIFGILATALAVLGLYGVMAWMVSRRAREIGIRIALGALTGNVVWLVMREVLILIAIGIAVGLPAALALTRLVQTQLYGIQPNDPGLMAAATLLMAVVAILAGYIPARRAAGFDPVRVLRYE